MRLVRVLVCALLVSNFPSLLSAQQAAPVTTPQAFAILQRALSALNAQQPLTDITLTASARRIAGSDDESGTATIKALASGASRLDLSDQGMAAIPVASVHENAPAPFGEPLRHHAADAIGRAGDQRRLSVCLCQMSLHFSQM